MRSTRVLAIAVAVVVLAHVAPARGEERPDDPAILFAAGTRAYQAGDYATAIVAYEEVYRRAPLPGAAFSLAQAHRNRYFADGDVLHLHRALALYRTYLAEAPRGPHRQHAAMHIETIEILLAHTPKPASPAVTAPPPATQLLITTDAVGATARVDGDIAAPTPRLVTVTPGPHLVRIEAPGHDPVERSWPAVQGELVVVPLDPRAQPARLHVVAPRDARLLVDGVELAVSRDGPLELPAGAHDLVVLRRGHRAVARRVDLGFGETRSITLAPPPTRQRRAARVLAWVSLGLVAGTGGATLLALDAQGDAEALPPPPRTAADVDAYEDARSRRDAWRRSAVTLGVSGVVVGLAAAALWRFDTPTAPTERELPAIEPMIGADRVGVTVRLELR